MLSLVEKQHIFPQFLDELFMEAEFRSIKIQLGELWRSDKTCELYAKLGIGIKNSCHLVRLALDLNVWVNDEPSKTKFDYDHLGQFWKALSTPDITCCWGGDFIGLEDFFHFSFEHNGCR